MRKFTPQTDSYYHVYNRGVDKRRVFYGRKDCLKFIENLSILNSNTTRDERRINENSELSSGYPELSSESLIDIICYCLLPNHYHLLIKQTTDNGLSKFMHKLNLSYTHYFNFKNKRTGSLFQGTYNAEEIKTDSYLLSLSCYIHGNPEIHGIQTAKTWPWSSYSEYLENTPKICQTGVIVKQFKNMLEYNNLVKSGIIESRLKKYGRKKTTNKRLA